MGKVLRRFATFVALSFVFMGAAPRWVLMDQQRLAIVQVVTMAEDDLDNKYFATPKGLTRIDKGDNFQIFTKENTKGGLGSDSITSLAIDRYRSLWVGTDGGGLSVYDNGSWKHYTHDSTKGGLPDDGVLALAVNGEDSWVATRNGFAVLHLNSWTTYSGEEIAGRLPNRTVTAIAVDSSGNKWIGTIGGLVKFNGSTWTPYTTENTQGGLPHNGITYLTVDTHGSLWVGTQAGVARMDPNGRWTNFQSDAELGELGKELTYSLSVGPFGEVWACIRGGSARFANGRWDLFTSSTTTGLMTRFIYYVMTGPDGSIWFATEKGVTTMYPVTQKEDDN